MLEAVLIEVEFGEERLVEAPAGLVVVAGVELCAVLQESQGLFEAFFDEPGVGVGDREELSGFGLVGVEFGLTALEVRQGDRSFEVGVDQPLTAVLESLHAAGLADQQALVRCRLLGKFVLD